MTGFAVLCILASTFLYPRLPYAPVYGQATCILFVVVVYLAFVGYYRPHRTTIDFAAKQVRIEQNGLAAKFSDTYDFDELAGVEVRALGLVDLVLYPWLFSYEYSWSQYDLVFRLKERNRSVRISFSFVHFYCHAETVELAEEIAMRMNVPMLSKAQ